MNKKVLLFSVLSALIIGTIVLSLRATTTFAQSCVPSYTECCADYYSKMVYEWDDGSGYCWEDACNIRDPACDPPFPPKICNMGDIKDECANECGTCPAGTGVHDYFECVDEVSWEWIGSDCTAGCDVGCGPAAVCTPYTECQFYDYGPNFCCAPTPKGNNVCNYEYWWYCNSDGTACDQGPYAYMLNSVSHACTSMLSCGICRAGETQTETQYPYSCNSSVNGGGCPGIEDYCSETINVQERYRTCNSDCGGWGAWTDWSTVNTYPQCSSRCSTSSDPSSSCYSGVHTHYYRCDGSVCIHDDASGTTTDPNCGGACSAPPPPPPSPSPGPAKYRCISGSCSRDDINGTTTDSNCGGTCSVPPSCDPVSVTVSPNPAAPGTSDMTFKATSSYAYTSVGMNTGGGTSAAGEKSFNVVPSYTWTWVYWNATSTPGTYNATFSGQKSAVGTCQASTSYVLQNPVPINLRVDPLPACSNTSFTANLRWDNTNSTLWADISTNNFASWSNKDVSNQTSTAAPAGFNPVLTLNPNTTYQWRLWNGSVHTVGPNFFVPFCVPSPPTLNAPSCPAPGTTASLSWNASSGATYYMLRADDTTANGWNGLCNGNQNPGDVCEDIAATSKNFASTANHTYNWWVHACNIAGCSSATYGTNFTCQPPPPPPCSNTTPGTNQLTGCTFDGKNFDIQDGDAPSGPILTSPVESATAMNTLNYWPVTGGPNAYVGDDTFSIRWKGNFTFKAGTYTFFVGTDDGARLKIGGVEKIDVPAGTSWNDQGYLADRYSATVIFTAPTTTELVLENYENGGWAQLSLRWTYTPPVQPWIQTEGGDVHSNTGVNAPGGP